MVAEEIGRSDASQRVARCFWLMSIVAGCFGSPAATPAVTNAPETGESVTFRYANLTRTTLLSLVIHPGEQVTRTTRKCPEAEVTPTDWQWALEEEGYVVEVGYTLDFAFGLRFRHPQKGIYGDLFVQLAGDSTQLCDHMTIRMQRPRLSGHPDPWRTRYPLSSESVPNTYFTHDDSFPAGY